MYLLKKENLGCFIPMQYKISIKKGKKVRALVPVCLLYTSSAKEGTGILGIFDAILEKLPENFGEQTITGNLVSEGDVVLLVMPQDMHMVFIFHLYT